MIQLLYDELKDTQDQMADFLLSRFLQADPSLEEYDAEALTDQLCVYVNVVGEDEWVAEPSATEDARYALRALLRAEHNIRQAIDAPDEVADDGRRYHPIDVVAMVSAIYGATLRDFGIGEGRRVMVSQLARFVYRTLPGPQG